MSVSLVKEFAPVYAMADNEAWLSRVMLPMYLSTVYPRTVAKIIYDDLKTNHLLALADLLEYERCYDNSTGTLVERD